MPCFLLSEVQSGLLWSLYILRTIQTSLKKKKGNYNSSGSPNLPFNFSSWTQQRGRAPSYPDQEIPPPCPLCPPLSRFLLGATSSKQYFMGLFPRLEVGCKDYMCWNVTQTMMGYLYYFPSMSSTNYLTYKIGQFPLCKTSRVFHGLKTAGSSRQGKIRHDLHGIVFRSIHWYPRQSSREEGSPPSYRDLYQWRWSQDFVLGTPWVGLTPGTSDILCGMLPGRQVDFLGDGPSVLFLKTILWGAF